jgi:hypothetical protein
LRVRHKARLLLAVREADDASGRAEAKGFRRRRQDGGVLGVELERDLYRDDIARRRDSFDRGDVSLASIATVLLQVKMSVALTPCSSPAESVTILKTEPIGCALCKARLLYGASSFWKRASPFGVKPSSRSLGS